MTLTSIVRLQSLIRFRTTTNFTCEFLQTRRLNPQTHRGEEALLTNRKGDYIGVSYMSILEVDVGIICACMPSLQLLLRRIAPRIFGSTVDSSSYLHPHAASRSRTRTFRNTNSHIAQSKSITKTTTTTVMDIQKDSDSVMELVDTDRQFHSTVHPDGSSFATVSTEHPQKPQW